MCDICGQREADPYTLLCDDCLVNKLHPWDRRRVELAAITGALLRQSFIEGGDVGARWTEKKYAEHMRRVQTPPKREDVKAITPPPRKYDPRTLVFELPLTPTGNQWLRIHWAKRKKMIEAIAAEIRAQIPAASGITFDSAKVHIIRQSSSRPDEDGLYGSVKGILDALQPASKRHPYGTYVIADDSSDCIDLKVDWEKAPPNKGKVLVMVTPRP